MRKDDLNGLQECGLLDIATAKNACGELKVADIPAYVSELLSATRYYDLLKIIDLRDAEYHGGTSLSSGVLPKWDFDDINAFIKVCSKSREGKWQADALHESYVMDLFAETGAVVAEAVPAYVLFWNAETKQDEIRQCEVALKFSGEVTYYRDLRKLRKYGKNADEIIEFTEEFPGAALGLLNMFAVDYVTNQEDRHAKNFGVLHNGEFTPLYDNGRCLFYSESDDKLHLFGDEVAQVKFLAKDSFFILDRYINWLGMKPNIDWDKVLSNLDMIDVKYRHILSKKRLDFNRSVVARRVASARKL